MASFNKVILLGYLTETPELKKTQSGVSVTSFRIGVSRKVVKDADQKTDFINIICWRERAEFVCRNFTKGNAILVCGSLQTRSWLDNDVKRYTTEVVADEVNFAERKATQSGSTAKTTQPELPTYSSSNISFEDLAPDDELPF